MKMAIRDWLRSHDLVTDVVLVVLVVLGVSACLVAFRDTDIAKNVLHSDRGHIYRTLATVSTALLGFVMATITLMVGLLSSERLRLLRQSGQQMAVANFFFSTMKCLGVTSATAVVGLLIDDGPTPLLWFEILVLATVLFAGARMLRAIRVLERIVKVMLKPKPSDARRQ